MKFAPLFAAALVAAGSAHATGPMQKAQAPGYYRMMLGDFEVTAISDGTVKLPVDQLLKQPADKTKKALARNFLAPPVETSVNTFLVNTGSKLVLIDTGAAGNFGPTLGNLIANLKAAGYQPEQVDEIYVTHLHADHVSGIAAGDKPAFPNAIVRADQREAAFWLSKEMMDKAPADAKGFFQAAMGAVGPVQAAGKWKPFDGATELVPGVKARPTYGHTAGHTIYEIESKGEKLVLWGDLMHVAAVQFADPSVTIQFDTDSNAARKQRQSAYAEAASKGYWVGAAHLAFPGVGKLAKEGGGYRFVPVNYSGLK